MLFFAVAPYRPISHLSILPSPPSPLPAPSPFLPFPPPPHVPPFIHPSHHRYQLVVWGMLFFAVALYLPSSRSQLPQLALPTCPPATSPSHHRYQLVVWGMLFFAVALICLTFFCCCARTSVRHQIGRGTFTLTTASALGTSSLPCTH